MLWRMNQTHPLRSITKAALAALACSLALASSTAAAPADLDPSFGVGGRVATDFAASDDQAMALAIQPDGRIVVVGEANSGTAADPNWDFAVARYLPDGTLDESFDGDGRVITSFGDLTDRALDVAVQPDGRIVVAGLSTQPITGKQFAVVRYRPDGSLDPDFSGDGRHAFGFDSLFGDDEARGVVLDGADIVVAGWSEQGARGDEVAIARLKADGSFDTSFGAGGRRTSGATGGPEDDRAYDLVRQPSGGYVAVGALHGATDVFALYRYDRGGTLDPEFGEDGIALAAFDAPDPDATAFAAALQSDGKLVAAGRVGVPGELAVLRILPDGQPDPSFDDDGRRIASLGAGDEVAWGVALDAGGKLLAAGQTGLGTAIDSSLVRYRPDGSLDPDFSGDGILVSPYGDGYDNARAVAVQPDGKIVAAGTAWDGSSRNFSILRLLGAPQSPANSHSGQDGLQPAGETPVAPAPPTGPCANLVAGTRGDDVLRGSAADDRLLGRAGHDRLSGLAGADCLKGGMGRDRLVGGPGGDRLVGGPGRNSYRAGAGPDSVNALNGRRERVTCGPGRDRVRADRGDQLFGCELVRRTSQAG
jgi:uncharacterized delta-60 repeat protein